MCKFVTHFLSNILAIIRYFDCIFSHNFESCTLLIYIHISFLALKRPKCPSHSEFSMIKSSICTRQKDHKHTSIDSNTLWHGETKNSTVWDSLVLFSCVNGVSVHQLSCMLPSHCSILGQPVTSPPPLHHIPHAHHPKVCKHRHVYVN